MSFMKEQTIVVMLQRRMVVMASKYTPQKLAH